MITHHQKQQEAGKTTDGRSPVMRLYTSRLFFPVILFLLAGLISIFHYSTSTSLGHLHGLFRQLYYIPLFLALFRYGLKGGLWTAALITVFYLPHFFMQQGGFETTNLPKILEISMLYVFAAIFGFLQNRLIRTGRQLEESNTRLTRMNRDMRRTARQLIAAEKTIRMTDRIKTIADLTAAFAHEIKNPLASLTGAAKICETEEGDSARKFARIAREEAERLNVILENFLSFIRDRGDSRMKESDVAEEAQHAFDLVLMIAEGRTILLENNLPRPVRILETEGALSRAVFNLLKNAVEATSPATGTVILGLSLEDDSVLMTVTDNGPGPDPGIDPLEPFTTTKPEGTGLGLTIVFKTIRAMKGELSWNRRGNRTEFRILLPVREKERI